VARPGVRSGWAADVHHSQCQRVPPLEWRPVEWHGKASPFNKARPPAHGGLTVLDLSS
jgi:hypothetical protein